MSRQPCSIRHIQPSQPRRRGVSGTLEPLTPFVYPGIILEDLRRRPERALKAAARPERESCLGRESPVRDMSRGGIISASTKEAS